MSPTGFLPDEESWDLPRIVALLDAARESIAVTCLTYSPVDRDGGYWEVLDNTLRRAAVRGVAVRLLVSDWSQRSPAIDFLKSLEPVPGIEVRLVTIPEAKEGFIPYARVIHSKFLTVDGRFSWLGTSNWEKSYFHQSRNVGLVVESRPITAKLDRSFDQLWNSSYAETVRPEKEYVAPRIGG
jgi:phosphatidylserine/phosphatidylglycerophosphate/cardiolipin synthase-like enzyme